MTNASPRARYELLKLDVSNCVNSEPTLKRLGILLGLQETDVQTIWHSKRPDMQTAAGELIRRWQGRKPTYDEALLTDELEKVFKDSGLALTSEFDRVKTDIDRNYPAAPLGQADGQTAGPAAPPAAPAAVANVVYSQNPADGATSHANVQAHGGHIETADFDVPAVPDLLRYKIKDYKNLGRAVIINNEKFHDDRIREGTDIDEDAIKKVSSTIGLELTDTSAAEVDGLKALDLFVLKDKELIQIRETLEKVSEMDYSDYACFCCFVLSHGNDRCVTTVDGGTISINELTGYFKGSNCPTLVGKPKLFFIQACQGGRVDRGAKEQSDDPGDKPRTLPSEADVFIFYATPFGYKSWRHPDKGSRFIQCLCAALEELYQTTEIMEIAAIVNDMVSQLEGENGYKQVSMVTSTLRKQFFFKHQRR